MEHPFAITLDVGSSLANRTGSWRTSRPVYVKHLPPCNDTCPAGENIQAWLFRAEEGNYHLAWQEIMKNNPLPAIMGRACYHTCESVCNRARVDETVGIHAVERFLGDMAIANGWTVTIDKPVSGKKVLVVGSGPAGLSAAYHLTRLGHKAIIHEAAAQTGGLMRYGIPTYRLPRRVLDAEIARIEAMGVEVRLNRRVEDLGAAMAEEGADAVFLASGAQNTRLVDFPTDGSVQVRDAISLLREIEDKRAQLDIGKRVAVYGGGNVAIDAARSAIRLGAKEVIIVYRRTRATMPAHDFEVVEALEEGIELRVLRTIERIENGGLVLEERVLTDTNRSNPTGRFEYLEKVDTVVMALGQLVDDNSFLKGVPGLEFVGDGVKVDNLLRSGREGVWAGGDLIPAERNLTLAVGHGKLAARQIDAYLRGETYVHPPRGKIAKFEKLNSWYYADAPKTIQPALSLIRRQSGFEEVLGNLDESNALYEARRCMSCGNCFECDNCYGACPDNAIIKVGPGQGFEFKYDYCKGCGLCVTECPCGAIDMVPETI
nr:Pyridine nucleotide-disulphide oxidoreductase family protein [uncultured bacterium]